MTDIKNAFWLVTLFAVLAFNQGCGKNGDQGLPGPSGATGAQGSVGATGPTGAVGPQGIKGVDAASISIVQLCSTCTPSYPSTFAEIGFCIAGNMYATYSANDGFSAYLPPGTYSSNGINCSCTFTLSANCVVN